MFLHIFLARSWQLKKVKVSHEEYTNVLYTVHRRSNNHSRCFCHQHQCCDYLSLSFNICRQTFLMIFLVPRYDYLKLTFSVSVGVFPHIFRSFPGSKFRVSNWHADRVILHKTLVIHRTLNIRSRATHLQFPRLLQLYL